MRMNPIAFQEPCLPGALQVKAVPAERGAGLGLLLGPGIQGFGQTLQPFLNTIKHRLPCCRLGGWPILDALLDWRRKGMVRALPRRGHTHPLPPPQARRAERLHGNPRLPSISFWLSSEKAQILKLSFVTVSSFITQSVLPIPILTLAQNNPAFPQWEGQSPHHECPREDAETPMGMEGGSEGWGSFLSNSFPSGWSGTPRMERAQKYP